MISLGKRVDTSLLDSIGYHSVDFWLVFRDLPHRSFWWRLLKPGFMHVECWGYVPPGAWIRFDTCLELISTEVYADPPWELVASGEKPTLLHYQALVPYGKVRQPWRCGPVTCVELTAAFLGIRLPLMVRTPYQLYKFLKRKSSGA